jgi:hypothetical protein
MAVIASMEWTLRRETVFGDSPTQLDDVLHLAHEVIRAVEQPVCEDCRRDLLTADRAIMRLLAHDHCD